MHVKYSGKLKKINIPMHLSLDLWERESEWYIGFQNTQNYGINIHNFSQILPHKIKFRDLFISGFSIKNIPDFHVFPVGELQYKYYWIFTRAIQYLKG